MKHSIETTTLQKIIDYLQLQPWSEVNKLIEELLANIKQLPQEPVEPVKPEIPPPRL